MAFCQVIVVGGTLTKASDGDYFIYKPTLLRASSDTKVVGGQIYLIYRKSGGYVITAMTEGYKGDADTVLKTENKMIALGFDKDIPISSIMAYAGIVAVYQIKNTFLKVEAYHVKITDNFVFQKGGTYLIVFDKDTSVTKPTASEVQSWGDTQCLPVFFSGACFSKSHLLPILYKEKILWRGDSGGEKKSGGCLCVGCRVSCQCFHIATGLCIGICRCVLFAFSLYLPRRTYTIYLRWRYLIPL